MWSVKRLAMPGIPSRVNTFRIRVSALPLATDETSAICMEFEKMNTMQAMSAKVKRTRVAMSQGEVFCILDSVGNSFPRISPEP